MAYITAQDQYKEERKTQKDRVLEILKRDGVINNFWCIDTRLTIRLGGIIGKLREAGWEIETKMIDGNCHYYLKNYER